MTKTFDLEALLASGLPTDVQEFLQAARDQDASDMTFRGDLDAATVRRVMEHLGVTPVWGRDGMLVYSIHVDGKTLVFGLAPDIEKDQVPPECLTREWVQVDSLPALVRSLVEWARGERELTSPDADIPELLAEDHAEVNAIGFFSPKANRVWLLDGDVLTENLVTGEFGDYAQVPHLIQSSTGRAHMARMIAEDKLQTIEAFRKELGIDESTPLEIPKLKQNDIIVDLMSATFADRYKARFLKGGPRASEA